MPTYEKSVDVAVPVRAAYDQWTRFETFPAFMSGVEEITHDTPTKTHWVTTIGGVRREFDATITEQRPDERIAWRSDSGPAQAGVVTFQRLTDDTTRVHLQMELEPHGVTEHLGAMTGVIGSTLQGDLECFKDFIEAQRKRDPAYGRETAEPETPDRSMR